MPSEPGDPGRPLRWGAGCGGPGWRQELQESHRHRSREVGRDFDREKALPLSGPTGLMGCYNLYSIWPDAFAPDTRGQLEMFAANAAGAVAVAVKLADHTQMSDDLHEALTSRAVIDQATGIIMAQERCSAAAAFDILRCASQNRNVKVRDLATEIVSTVGGKPPQPGTFQPRRS